MRYLLTSGDKYYIIGHMKKLAVGLVAMLIGLTVGVRAVSAHEGSVDLTNSSVSCKGVSIYQEGNYQVTGRCDGLVYPYQTLYSRYVLWGKASDSGQMMRIAEIDRGYFSGTIATAFDSMYVTAEKDGLVRRPSSRQILAGKVIPFSFDKSQVTAPVPAANNTTVQAGSTTTVPASSTVGAVAGKILSSLLVIILVIVGLVIGASLIFRSRGSVSA